MIKKMIEKMIKYVEIYVDDKISNLEYSIIEFEKIKNYSDKEIIELFKHTRFSELSNFHLLWLINKYNFKYWESCINNPSEKDIFPFCYVSDAIEKILKSKEESNNDNN